METPTFKYEKIELVFIYEISRELVCKYGISGCSRCLTLYSTVNPIPPQVQFEVQIEKAHLPVELWESYVFGSESNPNP